MSSLLGAIISGAVCIYTINQPGDWKIMIALNAFFCGLNLAIAVAKGVRSHV